MATNSKELETSMKYPALLPASFSRHSVSRENERKEQNLRNAAYKGRHFSQDLLATLLPILAPCPVDQLTTRVFRQHQGEGLCWHDAFFMMIFESSAMKPSVAGLLKELVAEMEATGLTSIEINPKHIQVLANRLKARYKSDMMIGYWEMLTLALHRYLLLGLVFLEEHLTKQETVLHISKLSNRRPSIFEMDFDDVHFQLKYGMYTCYNEGLDKKDITNFYYAMNPFIQTLTDKTLGIQMADEKFPKVHSVLGYCFSIQKMSTNEAQQSLSFLYYPSIHESLKQQQFMGSAHILSVFSCGDQWILYDNEVGTLAFSEEDSAKIKSIGIKTMQMLADKTHYTYKITLQDDTILILKQDRISLNKTQEEVIRAETKLEASCLLIDLKQAGGSYNRKFNQKSRMAKTRRNRKVQRGKGLTRNQIRELNRSRRNKPIHLDNIQWGLEFLTQAVEAKQFNLTPFQEKLVLGNSEDSNKARQQLRTIQYIVRQLIKNKHAFDGDVPSLLNLKKKRTSNLYDLHSGKDLLVKTKLRYWPVVSVLSNIPVTYLFIAFGVTNLATTGGILSTVGSGLYIFSIAAYGYLREKRIQSDIREYNQQKATLSQIDTIVTAILDEKHLVPLDEQNMTYETNPLFHTNQRTNTLNSVTSFNSPNITPLSIVTNQQAAKTNTSNENTILPGQVMNN